MIPSLLQRLIVWLLTPARPGHPGVSYSEDRSMSKAKVDLMPSAADASIKKVTITPVIDGTAGAPVDTTPGVPVEITAPFGSTAQATETVTNALGFTSDPSDLSPALVVADPRPARPAPPTAAVVGVVPDPTPAP